MFKKIYKKIEEYDTIVIARHIGVDPDALASQLALRDSIKLSFPKKNVYAVGNSVAKFKYFGVPINFLKVDKILITNDWLLIYTISLKIESQEVEEITYTAPTTGRPV